MHIDFQSAGGVLAAHFLERFSLFPVVTPILVVPGKKTGRCAERPWSSQRKDGLFCQMSRLLFYWFIFLCLGLEVMLQRPHRSLCFGSFSLFWCHWCHGWFGWINQPFPCAVMMDSAYPLGMGEMKTAEKAGARSIQIEKLGGLPAHMGSRLWSVYAGALRLPPPRWIDRS